jgi:hypothetical protein
VVAAAVAEAEEEEAEDEEEDEGGKRETVSGCTRNAKEGELQVDG